MSGSLLYAFLTGITTGGLSCYAVQGGLLTGAVARTVEKRAHKRNRMANLHQPILLFLFAKLLIHALLGFLLGMVGTAFKLTPFTQGLFQIAIGVFMVGNGFRLLNVSPIFRYFTFEPPRSLTRFIRRKSKDNQEWTTPALLGILTVLIPCGITQVMMATAMGAKSPAEGAGILAAFVLGTTPVFFLATYSAVRIGAMFEKHFIRFIAVAILIFGFISVDTGLNLVGSPLSASRLWLRLKGETPAVVAAGALPQTGGANQSGANEPLAASPFTLSPLLPEPEKVLEAGEGEIIIQVLNGGYKPQTVFAPAGKQVTLTLVTRNVYSCSRAFIIPAIDYGYILPATGEERVTIPPQKSGTVMPFSCSMGMYVGQIVFE